MKTSFHRAVQIPTVLILLLGFALCCCVNPAQGAEGPFSSTGTFILTPQGGLRFAPDGAQDDIIYELNADPTPYYDYLGVRVQLRGVVDSEFESWEMEDNGRKWLAFEPKKGADTARKVIVASLSVESVTPLQDGFVPARLAQLNFYGTPGGVPVEVRFLDAGICYIAERYVAVEATNDESGQQTLHFLIRTPDTTPEELCVKNASPEALSVESEDNCFFQGFSGNAAIIDCGTGTDPRQLLVYDLERNTMLLNAPYFSEGDLAPVLQDGGVFEWTAEVEVDSAPPCPQAQEWESQGFSVIYMQKRTLNLGDGSVEALGPVSCVMGQ